MIENYTHAYRIKYGSLPRSFDFEPETVIWIEEQIILTMDGKRGEITEKEINEKFGFAGDEEIL